MGSHQNILAYQILSEKYYGSAELDVAVLMRHYV